MKLLNRQSLWVTLDSVSESLFYKRPLPMPQRRLVARWIAGRQGLPGSYADMFAPAARDADGIRLFTGETVRTRVGTAHILGEEACRTLSLLGVTERRVQEALARAVRGMHARLGESEARGYHLGMYCCGTCSVAYWRNLAIGLWPRSAAWLRQGLAELKQLRTGEGRWRRFPFFYTCLALTEIGPKLAKSEMQYAAPYWQRNLERLSQAKDKISQRRATVGQRLLEMCAA